MRLAAGGGQEIHLAVGGGQEVRLAVTGPGWEVSLATGRGQEARDYRQMGGTGPAGRPYTYSTTGDRIRAPPCVGVAPVRAPWSEGMIAVPRASQRKHDALEERRDICVPHRYPRGRSART
jgi:hypothetical protein